MIAEYEKTEEEKDFHCYVADSINLLADKQKFVRMYSDRYKDLPPEDTRTGEEIAADVIKKAGLTYECI